MHIALLLIIVGVLVYLFLVRSRGRGIEPTDLRSLNLRSIDEALGDLAGTGDAAARVWAVAFLDDNPQLDIHAMSRYLSKKWKLEPMVDTGSSPLQRVIRWGEAQVAFEPVMLEDKLDFEGRKRTWEDVHVPQGCVGGILITATSTANAVGASFNLSQAVQALLDTCPQASGFYWMSSEQVFGRRELERLLGKDLLEHWPMDVWVATASAQNADGTSTGYTLGLETLGSTEFEAVASPESPSDLEERLQSLALYAASNYRSINNGDTTGVDCAERIRLKKKPSETVHKGWVFQLHYERTSPNSAWHRGG